VEIDTLVGGECPAHRSEYRSQALALTYAFEVRAMQIRVTVLTDVLNQQSRRRSRAWSKGRSVLRNHMIMPGGRYRDSVCFSIIETEWPEQKLA